MERDELARKIRENIFEVCGQEGRASETVIERAIDEALAKHLVKTNYGNAYIMMEDATKACPTVISVAHPQTITYDVAVGDATVSIAPGNAKTVETSEWLTLTIEQIRALALGSNWNGA